MAVSKHKIDQMPVIKDNKDFDRKSGGLLEQIIFNNRRMLVAACIIISFVFLFLAKDIVLNASFEKVIPQSHEFTQNYFENKGELAGLGNVIRVVVENTEDDIFDPEYLDILSKVNDELLVTIGVDRAWMKSIWMPSVRWTTVNEEGFDGGGVMPDTYDGSEESLQQLRVNIANAGLVGKLVANNFKSSMIFVPMLEIEPSGEQLDYGKFSDKLEEIRSRYEAEGEGKIKIHIVGFAKILGDLLDGMAQMMFFFAAAALIAGLLLFLYTRCLRSTLLVVGCSIVAVVWQLGLITALGFELDPYSILVPFLVFAIGVSHGAQKMNGIMQDIGRGTHRVVAARYTFRRLFLAGLTAILSDTVGFAVLSMIDIPVIQALAITASIGVGVLVFTNLILLPVLLSFTGVNPVAAQRSLRLAKEGASGKGVGVIWECLDRFTTRRWAIGALTFFLVVSSAGLMVSSNIKIGDLDPGAPELRPDSRYNLDNAYVTENYSLSSDLFAVILKTPVEGGMLYESMIEADRLGWALRQVPGVQTTTSLADSVRVLTAGSYEANPKWLTLARSQYVLNYGTQQTMVNNPELFNTDVSVMPIIAYLSDHKAETLERVVAAAEKFSKEHSTEDRQFLLAAGNSGIDAATNIVVKKANRTMMLYVYAAVIILCFLTFRSWRAVVVAVLPLVGTSILCEALMVYLDIGIKVATLPVIALGVGIGVDYAFYLLSVQLAKQREGETLVDAYKHALQFTGKVVALIGVTLAVGVITWVFSSIKFQADMGILLTFMFLWNMFGALVLIPALSHFFLNDKLFVAKMECEAGESGKESIETV